jgi:spore coat protein U-like protein
MNSRRSVVSRPRRRQGALAFVLLPLACGSPLACDVAVSPLAFGNINPLHGADSVSAATIVVTCAPATPYSVALSAGSGTHHARLMFSGANTLAYNLYSDASQIIIWGDGTSGTQVVDGSDAGSGSTHTIYAKVPTQPRAVPGAYADSIVVTVTY